MLKFLPSKLRDVFISDNVSLFLWAGTGTVIIITSLLAYYKVLTGPDSAALHYNVLVGVDVLGDEIRLYLIPVTGLVIALINVIVIRFLPFRHGLLEVVLAAGSLLANLILLSAMLLLFSVN